MLYIAAIKGKGWGRVILSRPMLTCLYLSSWRNSNSYRDEGSHRLLTIESLDVHVDMGIPNDAVP